MEALHALPALPDGAAAERLTKAESLMAGGLPARETLAKVIPTAGLIVVANHNGRGNPNHLPAGTPKGGEFTSAAYAGSGGQPNLDTAGKGKNDVRATEPPAPKKATKTPAHTDEDTVYQAVIGFERKRWTPEHQKDDDIAYPPKILRLKDGQTFSGTHPEKNIVQMPVDASLQDSVALGKWIGSFPPAQREALMIYYFHRGGKEDYQRTHATDNEIINRRYIDFGNFNYGVVAAAAGYDIKAALNAAALLNLTGAGKKGGALYLGNTDSEKLIVSGFDAVKSGNIPDDSNNNSSRP